MTDPIFFLFIVSMILNIILCKKFLVLCFLYIHLPVFAMLLTVCMVFVYKVAAENMARKPYINWAVKRVTRSLQVLWPRSRTNVFGSNATGLALPSSDVDLVVCLPPVRNLVSASALYFSVIMCLYFMVRDSSADIFRNLSKKLGFWKDAMVLKKLVFRYK